MRWIGIVEQGDESVTLLELRSYPIQIIKRRQDQVAGLLPEQRRFGTRLLDS
jgi:hypothetical protein